MALMLWEPLPFVIVTMLLALLVVLRHRANIRRMIAGTESRLGARAGR